jgi:predicted dehydrogenase
LDFQGLTVTTRLREQPEPLIASFENFERNSLFLNELEHFLDCVASRCQPRISLADGFASLKIALAVKESIATRMAVTLAGGVCAA